MNANTWKELTGSKAPRAYRLVTRIADYPYLKVGEIYPVTIGPQGGMYIFDSKSQKLYPDFTSFAWEPVSPRAETTEPKTPTKDTTMQNSPVTIETMINGRGAGTISRTEYITLMVEAKDHLEDLVKTQESLNETQAIASNCLTDDIAAAKQKLITLHKLMQEHASFSE